MTKSPGRREPVWKDDVHTDMEALYGDYRKAEAGADPKPRNESEVKCKETHTFWELERMD